MRLLIAAIAAMLLAPLSVAFAQSDAEPYLASMTVGLWATPKHPGEHLDPFDPLIREKIGTLLICFVIEIAEPLTPDEFDQVQREIANGAGMTEEMRISSVPRLLTDSVGYLEIDGLGSDYLIVAYEENLVFMLTSTSPSRASGHESDLDQIARNYLTSFRQSSPPTLTQVVVEGFVGNDDFTIERPLSYLPSQGDLPAEFQLLDKDFIEITVASLPLFGSRFPPQSDARSPDSHQVR